MDSQKKKLILLILLIITFISVFVVFTLFLTGKLSFNKNKKRNKESIYLNIDKNKVIENPSKEDLKNLIDEVQNSNGL